MDKFFTFYAKAANDSVNGRVEIKQRDGTVELDCVPYVAKGDSVIVTVNDGIPTITGIIGQGDVVNRRIHQNKADNEYIAILSDIDLWEDSEDVASNDEEFKPSKIARVCKRNYDAELWSYSRIENVHNKNKITDEEYM